MRKLGAATMLVVLLFGYAVAEEPRNWTNVTYGDLLNMSEERRKLDVTTGVMHGLGPVLRPCKSMSPRMVLARLMSNPPITDQDDMLAIAVGKAMVEYGCTGLEK